MLTSEIGPLTPVHDRDERAPASEYRFNDGVGRVGIIASVSKPFCLNCNRLRLTADGQLRYCLFAIEETNIKSLLRGGATDGQIISAVSSTVQAKWLGHEIGKTQFVPPPRPMYAIGG
jgi:cyclic pyranopterin phosphate synthase